MNKIRIVFSIGFLLITVVVFGIKPDRKYRFYPEKLGLIYKDINVITPDGLKIKTWFYPAQDTLTQIESEKFWNNPQIRKYETLDNKKRPTVIICNGDNANMSWQQYYMVMSYTANGYNVVTFDWRGFGESDEWEMNTDYLVYTELLIDYNSVIEEVIKQPEVAENRIALIGWSTGAYLSMAAASKRTEVKCFVGQALMTSFKEVIPTLRKIEKFKEKKLIVSADYPNELNPIELAPKFDKSTFLIVGENDNRTPVWMSKQIMAKIPAESEIWIVPGATHGGPDGPTNDFKLYNKKILGFLDRYL
jgi:pimeloyl-ACP methyl ester carboxylesterase